VVEREDHALSIQVQYEKHPLFCAHCIMLGHNIQSCSKLSTVNKSVGPANPQIKPQTVNAIDNVIAKSGLIGKKPVNASSRSNLFEKNLEAPNGYGKKPNTSKVMHSLSQDKQINSSNALEEGEVSPVLKDLSSLNDTSEVHASGDPSKLKLTLHNSFELLEDGEDNIAGEARPTDGELPFIAIEEDLQIRDNNVEVTIEKANLLHLIASKVTCNLVNRPSQSTTFSPIKMATPITTYEQIGPDKSKVKLPSSSINLSAAAIKSVKLLSKFWGDEVDEEPATDNTMD